MRTGSTAAAVFLLLFLGVGCGGKNGLEQEGMASWYGLEYHGRTTASGERFNQNAMTAAHKELPFGTVVKVTNQLNGRDIAVRINDRGPFIPGRIIDLSRKAARKLDMIEPGVVPVKIRVLEWGRP